MLISDFTSITEKTNKRNANVLKCTISITFCQFRNCVQNRVKMHALWCGVRTRNTICFLNILLFKTRNTICVLHLLFSSASYFAAQLDPLQYQSYLYGKGSPARQDYLFCNYKKHYICYNIFESVDRQHKHTSFWLAFRGAWPSIETYGWAEIWSCRPCLGKFGKDDAQGCGIPYRRFGAHQT